MKFLIDQKMMFLELTGTIKGIVRSLGNCLYLFSFFFFFFFKPLFLKKLINSC